MPHPYGVQVWQGEHQVGCQGTCYINIRAVPQAATTAVDANGRAALRQEFERQRPLGAVSEDGDTTAYREILTIIPLVQTHGLAAEEMVPALFIDAFYRYGDAVAEEATRDALAALLESVEVDDAR